MSQHKRHKKVYVVCNVKPDLSYDNDHRMYDEVVGVDEIVSLPARLQTGDKVIVGDIFTTFPTYNFMLTFLDFTNIKTVDGNATVKKPVMEYACTVWYTQ